MSRFERPTEPRPDPVRPFVPHVSELELGPDRKELGRLMIRRVRETLNRRVEGSL